MNNIQQSQSQFQLIPRSDLILLPKSDTISILNSNIYQHIHDRQLSQKTDDKTDKTQNNQRQYYQKQIQEKDQYIRELTVKIDNMRTIGEIDRETNMAYTKIFDQIRKIVGLTQIDFGGLIDQIEEVVRKERDGREELEVLRANIADHVCEGSVLIDDKKYIENQKQNKNKKGSDQITKIERYQQIIKQKEQSIADLRTKLLQSTQNNINKIFHTQYITQPNNNISHKQLTQLQQQIQKLRQQNINNSYKRRTKEQQCLYSQQFKKLINNYQTMLETYQRNERIYEKLESKQDQFQMYLSALKNQIMVMAKQNKGVGYYERKIGEIQKQMVMMAKYIQGKNQQNQGDKGKKDGKSQIQQMQKVFFQQIQQLNRKLIFKEKQCQNIQARNIELQKKLKKLQEMYSLNRQKMATMQLKLRDQRITDLQNTIIDHIGSRTNSISINSQQSDRQKQINNIRNLKSLVKDLRQRNRNLQQKLHMLKNLQNHSQQFHQKTYQAITNQKQLHKITKKLQNNITSASQKSGVERVTKDQNILKMIQKIIYQLLQIKRQATNNNSNSNKCQCIETMTYVLLDYLDDFPEMEDILAECGLIATSSNLLPVPFGDYVTEY